MPPAQPPPSRHPQSAHPRTCSSPTAPAPQPTWLRPRAHSPAWPQPPSSSTLISISRPDRTTRKVGEADVNTRSRTGPSLGPTGMVTAVGTAVALCIMGDSLMYSILPLHAVSAGIALPLVGILLSANRFIRLLSNRWAGSAFERYGSRLPFVVSVSDWSPLHLCLRSPDRLPRLPPRPPRMGRGLVGPAPGRLRRHLDRPAGSARAAHRPAPGAHSPRQRRGRRPRRHSLRSLRLHARRRRGSRHRAARHPPLPRHSLARTRGQRHAACHAFHCPDRDPGRRNAFRGQLARLRAHRLRATGPPLALRVQLLRLHARRRHRLHNLDSSLPLAQCSPPTPSCSAWASPRSPASCTEPAG